MFGWAEDRRKGRDMAVMNAMPHVLLAVKDESMLQMIRDMLRRCSVESIKTQSSFEDAKIALRAHARKWDIFFVDGGFHGAISEIGAIREEMGPHVKILYMVAMPAARDEVTKAVRAGIDGFIGTPFSQATLEDKIDELMGKETASREISRTSILYQVY